MPVRIRITLLFASVVFVILFLLCTVVYYVSYNNRVELIKTRLINRATNTANLLNKSTIFNSELVQKVDSTLHSSSGIKRYRFMISRIARYISSAIIPKGHSL